jgi:hypothetical protein
VADADGFAQDAQQVVDSQLIHGELLAEALRAAGQNESYSRHPVLYMTDNERELIVVDFRRTEEAEAFVTAVQALSLVTVLDVACHVIGRGPSAYVTIRLDKEESTARGT